MILKARFIFNLLGLLCILLQPSCILHPRYERPCLEVPEKWRIPTCDSTEIVNIRWWQNFNDPVLDQLILDSLAYNNDLKIAVARVYQFAARYVIVRSQFFPQIFGDVSRSRERLSLDRHPTSGPLRTTNQFDLFASLSYEVDLWGRITSATEAAYADLLAEEETQRGIVLAIVTAVAESYIRLRQFDQQLEISRETLRSRTKSYELALYRFEGGLTGELEPKQAESEVESAKAAVIVLERSIGEEENLLSILVGRVPGPIERRGTIGDLMMPICVPAGIPSDLLNQRPDVLRAEQFLIAANARIGEAKAEYFPKISLTGLNGNQSIALSRLLTGDAETWQYAVNALQPIFTGGRLIAQTEVREAEQGEVWYQYAQTVLVAFKEVNDALIARETSAEELEVQIKRVSILEDYLRLATLQYESGESDYLNVLDAERTLFSARLERVQSESDTFLSLIDLYRALGGGWVVDAEDLMECL